MGIILDKICFNYQEKEIFHNFSLEVKKGDQIGIVGSSGCGKSTLLKIISGLYEVKEGYIRVAGMRSSQEIRKKVAVVMQAPMLLPGSIRENITCGHQMSDAWIQHVCELAQLSTWIHTLPEGINYDLGERSNRLSGGQAQRIAIARALAKNAEVILLDEATSALDSETKFLVMKAIERLTVGKTVIHVTHQPELLKNCSQVYRMEDGKLYER